MRHKLRCILAGLLVLTNKNKGIPPTIRELMEYTGISSTAVLSYGLEELQESGYIEYPLGKNTSRQAIITQAGYRTIGRLIQGDPRWL